MHQKKLFLMIFFIITSLLMGCTFRDEPSNQVTDDEDGKQDHPIIELSFWRNLGNEAENKAFIAIIEAFEEKNPHIKINMSLIPFGDYEIRLRTEVAAGNTPDIMAIDSPNLATYANANAIRSIDAWMEAEGNLEDIPMTILNGLIYNDEIYLAPIADSSIAMFYNKNLFKEKGIPFPSENPNSPWTWDEVLEAAKQLTDLEKGVYGIDPAQGFPVGEAPAYFKLPLMWQFGAEIISEDGRTTDGYLNSPKSLKALQFYQDLYHKHKVAAFELPPNPFATEKVAISIEGSWALEHLQNNFPDFTLGEDFGIAPLPIAEKQVAANGGWALGISTNTEYPEEAWEFVKFATSYEGIKIYVEKTGDIPARYSVVKEFPKFNQYPHNIFLIQSQKYSKNRPVTPIYPTVSATIRELFLEVGVSNENVLDAANRAVRKIDQEILRIENNRN
ncbi:ABC transporter substrate-binding protein [Bacillus sp. PS06]|uniref:ABC transporter substrate-binding protein n=1 Tax=Bacillus sp. PS06 TaxID=2764176 RepID=UPI001786FD0C|nr:sugar ABC transporter substrate-binding protein [Bacillus sp. PS06]MBD8068724.1 sugar ABC transporter substrate-binding protein [Bacillus sp. PS06]